MATHTTTTAVGEKEQLADIIYKIDSDETPIFSLAKKETVNGTLVEWQVQELATAGQNSLSEGADATYATPTATTRLNNYTQIAGKDFAISGTLEAVDSAGRAKESAYQSVLKGLELRRDIEKIIGDLNVAKSGSEPRKTATLITWVTNGSADPADISFASGDGSDVADLTGTEEALTLAKIDTAVTEAWQDGGKPRVLVCDATNKANISDLSQAGTNLVTKIEVALFEDITKIALETSVYLTDFGTLELTPSRFMSNDKLFVIDPDHIKIGTLNGRNFTKTTLARTGDAIKEQILSEFVLMPTAPKAHGAVIGLSGA